MKRGVLAAAVLSAGCVSSVTGFASAPSLHVSVPAAHVSPEYKRLTPSFLQAKGGGVRGLSAQATSLPNLECVKNTRDLASVRGSPGKNVPERRPPDLLLARLRGWMCKGTQRRTRHDCALHFHSADSRRACDSVLMALAFVQSKLVACFARLVLEQRVKTIRASSLTTSRHSSTCAQTRSTPKTRKSTTQQFGITMKTLFTQLRRANVAGQRCSRPQRRIWSRCHASDTCCL